MVLTVEALSCGNHDTIAKATREDNQFKVLKQVICQGWPQDKGDVPFEALPFWDYRDELSTYNGVVYRGERVCIPTDLRAATLKTIHSSHLGIVKCKQRARELVFWPGMNKQIEDVVGRCSACLTYRNKMPREPMIIHPVPSLPWSKVGTDLCELNGKTYLVLVDYYSNFIEVAPLKDTRTSTVIRHMKENIARYGIMDTLVSDNGPQYSSAEFKAFTSVYGINHLMSSPLHQQANGLAGKAVQMVKNIIKKCTECGDDIYLSLLELRNTPRDEETGSPMQRLMGRRGKTLLPITPNLRKPQVSDPSKVTSKLVAHRQQQKYYYDWNTKDRKEIGPGDAIRIQTPSGWKPAEVVGKARTPRSYIVKAGDSAREYRRNTEHLMRTREEPHKIVANEPKVAQPYSLVPGNQNPKIHVAPDAIGSGYAPCSPRRDSSTKCVNPPRDVPKVAKNEIRTRSGRESRKPKYLDDFVRI
ncbi:uncharacterized protein LOC132559627 [Ylistrum balloti]|uniref:uncharacterized protein LOC132559627 n=1 Tax=Ylistrum balloti TaxID=509963 RepID=UPI002905EFD0|nr:uncharacterized protein LOC132559627 [Ylistrum balloti]